MRGRAGGPLCAYASQPSIPVVGVLYAGSSVGASPAYVTAFRQGVAEAGFVEGTSVAFDFRSAENDANALTEIAADLVHHHVAVIVIPGSAAAVRATMATTSTIPIVFMNASDPVQAGLVASLSRPGGNVTGITDMGGQATKRLGLLHELLPEAKRVSALLSNVSNLSGAIDELRMAASTIPLEIDAATATTKQDIDNILATFAQKQTEALWVGLGPLLLNSRKQITSLAARYAIPAVYPLREFAEVGGLMSYGSNIADRSRQAGIYVGRIHRGEKPADLPVMRNTKFELIINLRTARTLGITVPLSLNTQADEVIE